jgi:hypothetical protein
MEYNILKTIETNYGYVGEEETIMTPFPSELTVIPGVGQIIHNLSLITKIHNTDDLNKISKKTEFESDEVEQLGSGDNAEDVESNTNDTPKMNADTDNIAEKAKIDIPFNEHKRKSMDEAVYQSLMHPKMFKTNSVIFTQTAKNEPKKTVIEKPKSVEKAVEKEGKKIKHKFHVYE